MTSALVPVKDKVSDFLSRKSRDREVLQYVLRELTEQLPETAIFGGMLREFGLGHVRGFSSDVDLVTAASAQEIGKAVSKFSPLRNKFGGYRFVTGKWRFDIWTLDQTWAIKQGYVEGRSMSDLVNTTFFNVDAAIFYLSNKELLLSHCYADGVNRRLLDINLLINPAPFNMAVKAIKLAMQKNLSISARLNSFILSHERRIRATTPYSFLLDDMRRHLYEKEDFPYLIDPQLSILEPNGA